MVNDGMISVEMLQRITKLTRRVMKYLEKRVFS